MSKEQAYLIWCPDLGETSDDGRSMDGYCAEDAVATWAQREDSESADYWIVKGEGTTVIARSPDGTEQSFRVIGEQAINYYARAA